MIDRMMKMIMELQERVNIQTKVVTLSDCFGLEGFERENVGAGPSKRENEEDKEEIMKKKKDDNQDEADKDKDDEDQGNTGLVGSDSYDTDDGDDDEVIVDNPLTNQGSKPVCTDVGVHVLEDLDEGDKIDNPIDVSSPIHKSDD
ncbi:hypothetical protein L1987_19012 [Smallanthus sonchifolius]|uniref:Uncharacterized protein n=1 Tax=Smallanthus sonchifolius TaxID=185202 RepID=A0ACB9J2C2_9ASTR|nr:hypothetical protein L1987_19012 [Smallanthus sonchifolius]